jgi:PEP-CTERM motif-containing protein
VTHRLSRALLACAAFAFAGVIASVAQAVPIKGGDTTVAFTVDLAANGATVKPMGGAMPTVVPNQFTLPITGGSITTDLTKGTLQHQHSGFDFDFGRVDVTAENLKFDFSQGRVSGRLESGRFHSQTDIFDLRRCNDIAGSQTPCTHASGASNEFGLFLRKPAADFFDNAVLSDTHFSADQQIALVTVQPTGIPAPEPATIGLLALGFMSLSLVRRRLGE